jgi:hypothetical protein
VTLFRSIRFSAGAGALVGLVLALTQSSDGRTIQEFFDKY